MIALTETWKEWIRTPADEQAVSEGCWFDLAAAERVREFFRRFLRHSKGKWAGKPFVLLDWQWNGVIAPMLGWRRADGTCCEHIDGIVALIMALERATSGVSMRSFYEDHEVEIG